MSGLPVAVVMAVSSEMVRGTGEFLAVLVRATSARRVLEIGTSNGYHTVVKDTD
jgi:predicted O-methyltransferase YrrM